jgi:hypothetical protein
MISSNQARIGNEAKSVVQAAESAAAQSATSAQQQAETVAGAAVMQSQSDSTTSSGSNTSSKSTSSQTQNSSIALVAATQTTVGKIEVLKSGTNTQETASAMQSSTNQIEVLKSATTTQEITSTSQASTGQVDLLKGPVDSTTTIDAVTMSSVTAVINSYVPQTLDNIATTQPNYSISDSSRYELLPLRGPTNSVETEIPQLDGIKIGTRSTLTDAIEQRPISLTTNTQEQKTDAVNKNVQSNDLAGKVDIASMATQPQGYQAYSMMMPDVAFYAPKEIYRNQVNVDNVRVLRQLSSDKLHRDLVNLQYK